MSIQDTAEQLCPIAQQRLTPPSQKQYLGGMSTWDPDRSHRWYPNCRAAEERLLRRTRGLQRVTYTRDCQDSGGEGWAGQTPPLRGLVGVGASEGEEWPETRQKTRWYQEARRRGCASRKDASAGVSWWVPGWFWGVSFGHCHWVWQNGGDGSLTTSRLSGVRCSSEWQPALWPGEVPLPSIHSGWQRYVVTLHWDSLTGMSPSHHRERGVGLASGTARCSLPIRVPVVSSSSPPESGFYSLLHDKAEHLRLKGRVYWEKPP